MEAAAVNLVAGEKPADVYSGIAARSGTVTCHLISIMKNNVLVFLFCTLVCVHEAYKR